MVTEGAFIRTGAAAHNVVYARACLIVAPQQFVIREWQRTEIHDWRTRFSFDQLSVRLPKNEPVDGIEIARGHESPSKFHYCGFPLANNPEVKPERLHDQFGFTAQHSSATIAMMPGFAL